MSRMYQCKFTDSHANLRFGIVQHHHEQAEEFNSIGQTVVEDILTGEVGVIDTDKLTEVKLSAHGIGMLDKRMGMFWGGNEIDDYLALEQLAHEIRNLRNPEGIHKHSTFYVGVGDGSACYVVTEASKRSYCQVEWRGYASDRWVAQMWGYGGKFRKVDVSNVGGGNLLNKLFGNDDDSNPDAKLAIFQDKYADYMQRFNVIPIGTLADLIVG